MLCREIIVVCSEIHTYNINTAVWAERRVCVFIDLNRNMGLLRTEGKIQIIVAL
jgi:hypothetical protein